MATFKLDVRLLLRFWSDGVADTSAALTNLGDSCGPLKLLRPLGLVLRALRVPLAGWETILGIGERISLQNLCLRSLHDLIVGFSHLIICRRLECF